MSLRLFTTLVFLGTALTWVSWGLVINFFNPTDLGPLGFMMFYLTLFLALAGSIFLISDWVKAKLLRNTLLLFRLRTSVRHAIFFSMFLVGWLFLKSLTLAVWWTVVLFILTLTVLEFLFISLNKHKGSYYEGAN